MLIIAQWIPNKIITGHRPAIRAPPSGGHRRSRDWIATEIPFAAAVVIGPITMKVSGTRMSRSRTGRKIFRTI